MLAALQQVCQQTKARQSIQKFLCQLVAHMVFHMKNLSSVFSESFECLFKMAENLLCFGNKIWFKPHWFEIMWEKGDKSLWLDCYRTNNVLKCIFVTPFFSFLKIILKFWRFAFKFGRGNFGSTYILLKSNRNLTPNMWDSLTEMLHDILCIYTICIYKFDFFSQKIYPNNVFNSN